MADYNQNFNVKQECITAFEDVKAGKYQAAILKMDDLEAQEPSYIVEATLPAGSTTADLVKALGESSRRWVLLNFQKKVVAAAWKTASVTYTNTVDDLQETFKGLDAAVKVQNAEDFEETNFAKLVSKAEP
ncbi:hypothetical protein BGZ73_002387 [Actinomortierella ambigua]|nr:hypothetical protein BGZ73_002387 [Actinomortierella ambigua]